MTAQITTTLTPPVRGSANFDAEVAAWVAALPPWTAQANALAAELNANLNLSALGVTATSATALAIGTGSKSLTVEPGRGFAPGMSVKLADTADPAARYMAGIVTAYNGGTGAMTVDVVKAAGSGTFSSWAVSLHVFPGPLSGAAAASGAVTLTAGSAPVQRLTAAQHGDPVTLPDATTMTTGGVHFIIENASEFDRVVRDASGAARGFIPPRAVAAVSLADNATAAGTWLLAGTRPWGIAAYHPNSGTGFTVAAVELDANRTLLVDSAGYGIVHDAAANTFGARTLLRSGIGGNVAARLIGTDKVLVASGETSTFAVFTVDVSGTALTPGTAATLSGSAFSAPPEIAVCGASFVLRTKNNGSLVAATVSGATVTLGTLAVPTTAYAAPWLYALDASTVLVCGATATSVAAQAYGVSGTTLTAGTEDALGSLSSCAAARAMRLDSGRVLLWYSRSGANNAFSLWSASGLALSRSDATPALNDVPNLSRDDWLAVSATKVLVMSGQTSVAPKYTHLTDTAGTLAASSAYTYSGTSAACALLGLSGAEAAAVINDGSVQVIDTSSAAPAGLRTHAAPLATGDTNAIAPSDRYGAPVRAHLRGGGLSIDANIGATARLHHIVYGARAELAPAAPYLGYAYPNHIARPGGAAHCCWGVCDGALSGYILYKKEIVR